MTKNYVYSPVPFRIINIFPIRNTIPSHPIPSHPIPNLAVMEGIYLLEDPCSAVSGHLINDLDRVLHLCVYIDTGAYTSVRSLAQDIIC